MARTTRKRSTLANRAIAASAALILGGGGLIAVNVYASAGEGRSQNPNASGRSLSTIDCPDVGNELDEVPKQARANVDRELATLDTQITTAYKRFADLRQRIERDPRYGQQQILTPLKNERTVILQRIAALIERGKAPKPQGLESMASCTLRADDNDGQNQGGGQGDGQDQGQGQDNGGQDQGQDNGQGGGNGGQAGNGPEQSDFVDIQSVQPNVSNPRNGRGASRGTFTT
ncbi:hypothetical protein QMZ92_24270, partial [Streptomyces sp. HNM0645]|nr:hypothetical protein [Streptomyces sp. HNM0645]